LPETTHSTDTLARQLPLGDEIFLDHVGHFVADRQAASAALARAGFAPTPVSVQVNPDGTPTGTGNVTAMLPRGYVEVLFKTADAPLAQEFEAALAGYAGVHLAAFSVADAAAAHRRLGEAGFPMRPLVRFQRPVDTGSGPGIAAFTVVRLQRGAMAEGRIQLLTHRTEHTVWQQRWLSHPNGAQGLTDLLIVAADPAEAAARFERFTARPARSTPSGRSIELDRGCIEIVTEAAFAALAPEVEPPRLPFIGAYAVAVASISAAESLMTAAGLSPRRAGKTLVVAFPPELGTGAWVLTEHASHLPWRP
jgi:glyoxalase-like protein